MTLLLGSDEEQGVFTRKPPNVKREIERKFSRSRDVIVHVTIRLHAPLFLLVPLCDQAPISSPFGDIGP